MPLDSFVTAVVENSLNALLRQDEQSTARLARLKGKVLRVRLTDIKKQLVFVFGKQVDVLAVYEGEVDCELTLALSILPQLRDKAQFTQLIKQEKLQISGDLDVAQYFSQLIGNLEPDVAEWLSKYTGDIVAHTLVTGAKRGFARVHRLGMRQQRYAAELLIEEWRLTPSELEIAHFADRVDDVASQASRLEMQLRMLEKKWIVFEKGQVNDTK